MSSAIYLEGNHTQVKTFLQPETINDTDHLNDKGRVFINSNKGVIKYLQSEHVLPEIISNLVNGFDDPSLLLSTIQHQLQWESIAVEVGAIPEDMKMKM